MGMPVDIVMTENVGGNCFSKVVGEKERSPMLINYRGIGYNDCEVFYEVWR